MTTLEPRGWLSTSFRSPPQCVLPAPQSDQRHLNPHSYPLTLLSFLSRPSPPPAPSVCQADVCHPSLPPWEHRQLVVCHCISRTGCTGGAQCVSGNSWGTDAPGHEWQTRGPRLHRVSRAVPSGPRWPATQWHPQLQGELRHCEHLAGRNYLS